MEEDKVDIIFTIIIASIVIVILATFSIFMLLFFVKKKRSIQKEQELMRTSYEQTLLQSQIEIQEQTLQHISQEIHDNIGQVLSLVSLNLNTLPTSDPDKLNSTDQLITKAIDDLRSLSKSLNPERVQQVGIREAIENELQMLERTGKYQTRILISKDITYPSPEKTVILYRMVQEVLTNIMKHSQASEIQVIFSESELATTISVTDNGKGFDADKQQTSGIGIRNIYQRAKMIGAEVEITSKENKGTAISFILKKDL